MQGPFPISTDMATERFGGSERSTRRADRAYQTLTIAAILLVLGSLWLF